MDGTSTAFEGMQWPQQTVLPFVLHYATQPRGLPREHPGYREPRWLWSGAIASAALFALGALRVVAETAQPVADFNNVWLAVWLIAHGVGLVRLANPETMPNRKVR